jgi:hypothetical protein
LVCPEYAASPHSLSRTEVGLDATHNIIRLLSERKGENFFLTSPLIGLIDEQVA